MKTLSIQRNFRKLYPIWKKLLNIEEKKENLTTKFINQITTGQTNLQYPILKIDYFKTDQCETCNKKETIRHFIYDSKNMIQEGTYLKKKLKI